MPLFELFRLTKAKLESSQEKKPSPHPDDVVELVWENGQIAMQSQSSKSRNTLALPTVQSHSPGSKGFGINGSDVRGNVNGVLSEIQVEVPSVDMGLGQEDDMARWLGYPLDESLHSGYCSDLLPAVSQVTAEEQENDVSNQTAFPFFHRRNSSGNQSLPACNDLTLGQSTPSKTPTNKAAPRPGGGASQSSPNQSYLFQAPSPYHRDVCEEPAQALASVGCFTQTQDPLLPNNEAGLINFSHFLRPAALTKADLTQSIKIASTTDRAAESLSNPVEAQLVELDDETREEKSCHYPLTKVGGAKEWVDKVLDESVASGLPDRIGTVSPSEKNRKASLDFDDSRRGGPEREKTVEPVVACSSVCSGNSLEGPFDGPSSDSKRKRVDTQDMECHSEDVEEESTDARKIAPSHVGSGSKRSRSAEVHNLSERRRRDRINEKMRALQELIPNCNKVDKASMLDEAIEYLKTLQLQVQIMSMGTGYYMPPMMLPPGMQHMGHYPPMGLGLGLGIGMGINYGMGMPDMNGSSPRGPMVQAPPMHGSQFPGPMALHVRPGSRLQSHGHPGRGIAVASLMSSPMEGSSCGVAGSTKNMEAAKEPSCKDPGKNNVSKATWSSSG